MQPTVSSTRRFAGRVAVVTGGGSGIGEAVCRGFAREGARVAVLGRNEDRAGAVAEACDGEARAYACDVAEAEVVRDVFERLTADLGEVEVLVNSAGIARRDQATQDRMLAQVTAVASGGKRGAMGATAGLGDEEWDRMIRVHLYGTFHCTREALKAMEPRRRGAIVNLTSVAALRGLRGAPDYSAAKGAIIGFTRSVAGEVAAAGIRVNAIAPGWIDTPMVREQIDPRLLPLLLARVPLGGIGRPEHVAALALHLCSDEAAYTTGQVVSPNGGLHSY
jgi:3-oxoacyl-[acyl-carrier protein] reductase